MVFGGVSLSYTRTIFWYFVIWQTGANIFSLSQTARVPEPNGLLIEPKILTLLREQDNACILVFSC